jgi:hypothetical protein
MTKCKIDNCTNKSLAKGMCNAHYLRSKKNKDLSAPLKNFNPSKQCIKCGVKTNGKGNAFLCSTHYKVYKRKKIREQLIQKLGGKCVKCNGIFPNVAFDFHHLGDKEMDISSMIDRCSE